MMEKILIQTAAAAVGTVAFALLFGVPRKYYPFCAVCGGAGWLLDSILIYLVGLTATEATFAATVLVILLSRFFAAWKKCPVTVFLISGIIPLVPGGGIYWTAYYLVTSQTDLARSSGFAAIKAAIAIVLGIVVVLELPNKLFQVFMKRKAS